MTRIKICGITRLDDAKTAVDAGAHAIGFVFDPASPRYIGGNTRLVEQAAKLPWVSKVAVFGVLPAEIPETAKLCDAIQWVEGRRPGGFQTGIRAVHLHPSARLAGPFDADCLLLDAHAEGKMGGTGKTVNWDHARQAVTTQLIPIILAGGLNPDNIRLAIQTVQPYGVDVSSGVESAPGIKSAELIRLFFQGVTANKQIE